MKELKHINKYFYKYRFRLIAGLVISIGSRYLSATIPEFVKNSINIADEYRMGNISEISIVKDELILNICIIVGLAIVSGFFTFLMRQTIIVTSRLVEFDLKNEIFQQYERLSFSFYKKKQNG